MKTTTKFLFICFFSILSGGIMAQTDLLSVSSEDGDFSEYLQTANQIWPPAYPAAANSWFADGVTGGTTTSVRNHNVEPEAPTPAIKNYHSKYHYIQFLMDNGPSGSNYLWRKISGLTSGVTYTFSFYYRMPFVKADHHLKFAVIDDLANIKVNPASDGINTFEGELGASHLQLIAYADSTGLYRKASYTFTVPAGKTVVYASWLRNVTIATTPTYNYRSFLDDMSLVVTPQISTTVPGDALTGFNYNLNVSNGPSSEQSFTVSGTYLQGNVTVTAPASYELSTTSGSGFTTTPLALTPTSGTLASTSVYARLISGLSVGNYNGNISLTAASADTKTVSLSGQVTDLGTGLSGANRTLSIRNINGNIEFSAVAGETVTVYNTLGKQLFNKLSVDGLNSIAINATGLVVVRVGAQTTKLILK